MSLLRDSGMANVLKDIDLAKRRIFGCGHDSPPDRALDRLCELEAGGMVVQDSAEDLDRDEYDGFSI